jgi:hypothetical protein
MIECHLEGKAFLRTFGDLKSITIFTDVNTYSSYVDLLNDNLYVNVNNYACPFNALLTTDELIKTYDHLSQKNFNFISEGGSLLQTHPLFESNLNIYPVSVEYKQKFVDFLRVFDEIKILARRLKLS